MQFVRSVCTPPGGVQRSGVQRKARAIVTDRGGMLSHASITARELKIPCVVRCKDATKRLSDGDEVFVDATKGLVNKL